MTIHPQDENHDYTLPFPGLHTSYFRLDQDGELHYLICDCPIPRDFTVTEAERFIEDRSYGGAGCPVCAGFRF